MALAAEELRLQAESEVERIGQKLDRALGRGLLDATSAAPLFEVQSRLRDEISVLPTPLP